MVIQPARGIRLEHWELFFETLTCVDVAVAVSFALNIWSLSSMLFPKAVLLLT